VRHHRPSVPGTRRHAHRSPFARPLRCSRGYRCCNLAHDGALESRRAAVSQPIRGRQRRRDGRSALGRASDRWNRGRLSARGVRRARGRITDDRNNIVDAGLEAIATAWPGQPVTSSTQWWTANGNSILPLRNRRTGPTIWIGGNTRRAIERAVRFGDGRSPVINPGAPARQIHTAKIDSVPALERGVAAQQEECARGRARPASPDLRCTGQRCAPGGRQFYDDLTRLEEVVVALVCLAPEGDTVPDLFAGGSSGSRPPSRLHPARPVPPMPDHEIRPPSVALVDTRGCGARHRRG
jgi:hypothetical protein